MMETVRRHDKRWRHFSFACASVTDRKSYTSKNETGRENVTMGCSAILAKTFAFCPYMAYSSKFYFPKFTLTAFVNSDPCESLRKIAFLYFFGDFGKHLYHPQKLNWSCKNTLRHQAPKPCKLLLIFNSFEITL